MATLNHSSVIKAFEKLSEDSSPENFFYDFLKALKFPAATIKRLKELGNNRNVATIAGDTALSKQIYFHPATPGEDLQAVLKERVQDTTLLKHKIRFFLTTDFENPSLSKYFLIANQEGTEKINGHPISARKEKSNPRENPFQGDYG